MPYTITIEQVKDGFTTSASDADLTAYIIFADQADECLTNNSVADALGQQLKILAVRHMATIQRDGGAITSERAVSGASRSFSSFRAGDTSYKDLLRQIDATGCVYGLVTQNGFLQLRSVGRRSNSRRTY